MNSSSKINIIYHIYITNLGLYIRKIHISIEKINKFCLDNFRIVIIDYSVKNRLEKI